MTFSPSGTNAAQDSTATLAAAGTCTITVTITNTHNLSTTSSVDLTVNQILTGIAVSPMSASITAGGTQQFTVTGRDQFDQPISNPPVTWTLTGPGSLSGNGLYTPAYAPGTATVQATSAACVSSASVTITGSAQWNSSADASWSASGSWADSASQAIIAAPGVRGIAGDTILFAGATGSTVRLDGASPTLADITFNSDATSYTIAQGSGGTLTLQCNAGAAVNVLAGSDAIGANCWTLPAIQALRSRRAAALH